MPFVVKKGKSYASDIMKLASIDDELDLKDDKSARLNLTHHHSFSFGRFGDEEIHYLETARQNHNEYGQGRICFAVAQIEMEEMEFDKPKSDKVEKYLLEAERIFQNWKENSQVLCLVHLAEYYMKNEDYGQAIKSAEKALRMIKNVLEDKTTESHCRIILDRIN